ncbi:MAG TPA: AI-2E family transporter [Solirubrobacteraceae bacterium]|jgi:predicted PurR-regulated permease PerM
MRLRLPRRSRGEPVSDPENGAHETREHDYADDGPPEPEASEYAVGADPRDYEQVREGERPGGDEPEAVQKPPPSAPPVVVPRWIQLVLLPVALLALWALARAAGSVLLILLVASVAALIINPLVRMLERIHVPRGLAILVVYLSGVAVLVGIGVALAEPVSTQVGHFQDDVPHLVRQANKDLANVQTFLDNRGIKVHIQQQGQTALQTLQKDLLKRSGDIVSFSRDLLQQLVTLGFDLILTLVLSIYLLVYGKQIGELVRRIMPAGDGTPDDDYPLLIQRAVFGYVRGQLLFSLIMGASAALGLWIFGAIGIFPDGQRFALFFGAFYGLMEFIPYIGPIIGPLPAILVALFNDPISAVWVTLLFIALQQLEGHFVAPQVFRISLRINPILIILSLLIGYQIYGIVGSLIALPIASVVRETVVYLRGHLVLEPWGTTTLLSSPPSPPQSPPPPAPEACPDCGARAGSDDVYCRSCGASLEPRVRTTTR